MSTSAQTKNPTQAALLSLLLPGLGHLYLGQTGKGIGLMVAAVISLAAIGVGVGLCMTPLVWAWAIYDAYRGAQPAGATTTQAVLAKVQGEASPAVPPPVVSQEPRPNAPQTSLGEMAARSTTSVSATKGLMGKEVDVLLRDLGRADDQQAQRLQEALAHGGPEAYKRMVERQAEWERAAAKGRLGMTDTKALARMQEARRRYEQDVPTEDLVALFQEGVYLVSEDLRDDIRSPISVWAEKQLRTRGPQVIPELLPLLSDKKSSAVCYYTVRFLSEFDDPRTSQPMLNVVASHHSPDCRYTALVSFQGNKNPEVMKSLVRAMVREVQSSYADHTGQRIADVTRLGLDLLDGGPGRSVGSLGGGGLGRGVSWLSAPMKSNMSKLKPLQRLEVFAQGYLIVLGGADPFPIDEMLALLEHEDPHVRQFMYVMWTPHFLKAPQEAQRQRFIAQTIAAAHGSDASTRDAAIAAMVLGARRLGHPLAAATVEQLLQSKNAAVVQRTQQFLKQAAK